MMIQHMAGVQLSFFFNNDDSGPFGAGQLECTQWGWLNFGSTKKAADATKFASSLLP